MRNLFDYLLLGVCFTLWVSRAHVRADVEPVMWWEWLIVVATWPLAAIVLPFVVYGSIRDSFRNERGK